MLNIKRYIVNGELWTFYKCPRCWHLKEKKEIVWNYWICSECCYKLALREKHAKELNRFWLHKANSIGEQLTSRMIIP